MFEVLSAQTRTSGGSSETLEKAETVMPWMRSPAAEVTIATPLAQRARAARKSSPVTGMGAVLLRGARVYPGPGSANAAAARGGAE